MSNVNYVAKVVNHCQISPPAGSVPETHLPLSFFDLLWIICPPMRFFFFYDFPHNTHHFLNSIFPTLKHSLSLTLQHFFPLASNLILPPPPHKPYILFTTDASVSFTVSESTSCDFNHLIANYPRHAKIFYPFVPDLPEPHVLPDGTRSIPLMALQLTVFPNQGLSICMAFHHVVADGMSAHHFFKSWAFLHRNGPGSGSGSLNGPPLPYLDRAIVKDPKGLESIFLHQLSNIWASSALYPISDKPIIDLAPLNKVRTTFVLSKTQIEGLKKWVLSHETNNKELTTNLRLSAFIVTCSLIWVCLIKSREGREANCSLDENKPCYLVFVADCRNRLKDPIPTAYFGNCLDMCPVILKKSALLKPNSIVAVAKAIGEQVKEFEREPLKMAEEWFSDWRKCEESGDFITIAGSPKLRAYETDFGWGEIKKVEMLHVDTSKAVSLHESRDGNGGIEVGLGLKRSDMDQFIAVWEQNLNLLCG